MGQAFLPAGVGQVRQECLTHQTETAPTTCASVPTITTARPARSRSPREGIRTGCGTRPRRAARSGSASLPRCPSARGWPRLPGRACGPRSRSRTGWPAPPRGTDRARPAAGIPQEDALEDRLIIGEQILVLDEFLARRDPRPLEARDRRQPVVEDEEQAVLRRHPVQLDPAIAHPVGVELCGSPCS